MSLILIITTPHDGNKWEGGGRFESFIHNHGCSSEEILPHDILVIHI